MNPTSVARRSRNQSSADFQVCRVADFQIRERRTSQRALEVWRAADLEIGDTAGLETCATGRGADAAADAGELR